MSKNEPQMNFVDEMASRENRGIRTAQFLGKLEAAVDFEPVEAALREACTAIRTAELTAASVHDSSKFKDVCPADTGMAIAGKAYDSAEHEAWLEARGIHSGLMEPARRNHPLSEDQQEVNGWLAATRAAIEKILGHWKRVLGWRRMRYTGLRKGTPGLQLKSVAWNLKRPVTLCAA